MSGPTEPAVTEYREGYAAIRPYMARWVPAKAWPAVIESDGSNLAEVVDLIHRSPALLRGADPGSAQAPKIRAVVNIARSASEMVRWAGHVHLMHQKGDRRGPRERLVRADLPRHPRRGRRVPQAARAVEMVPPLADPPILTRAPARGHLWR